MSAALPAVRRPFVTALRTPRGVVTRVGDEGGERVTIRVQFEPLWDAVAFDVRSDAPVESVIRAALDRFGATDAPLVDFVVKLRGHEVVNAATSIGDSGARDGSTFHVHHRYRRPVR